MKQLFGIFLCLCLAAPFLGTYGWLRMEKHRVRKDIKQQMIAGIDKDMLVYLKFSRHQTETILDWHHGGEFEYLGQMYDIVEMKEQGDSIAYWCWWDKAETSLNRQLNQLAEEAQGQNPKNTQQKQKLTDFQKHLFHSKSRAIPQVDLARNNQHRTNSLITYSQFSSAPPSPPPEIA